MNAENILILTAVQMETRAVMRALRGRECRFETVGIGAKFLPKGNVDDISLIIMCGVAGALDPYLKVGDVVLDNPSNRSFAAPGLWKRGTIHTATQIISTPIQKAELFAGTGALAVDMEQALIQDFARPFNIPVIGLRAISDTANQTLDPAVLHLVDDLGKPKPLSIASLLIRRPGLIRYLKQLGANTKLAVNNLGQAAVALVDTLTAKETDADFAKTSG